MDDFVGSSLIVVDSLVLAGCDDGNVDAIGPPRVRSGDARSTDLKAGTIVTITGDSVTTKGVVWWPIKVASTGNQGWVEATKLESLSSGPEPTATP